MAKKKPKARKTEKRPRKVVEYAMAKRAVSQYGDELLALPGVTGISVGPRFQNDEPVPDEMTIRLHVSTKKEKQYLKKNANELGLRKQYWGVGLDIVVWNFKSAFDLNDVADGDRISSSDGGSGSLGTKVITRIDSTRTVVWLTAAHVASPNQPDQGSPVVITKDGQRIGTVSADHYFRDENGDAAYIVPDGIRLKRTRPRRTIAHLTATDEGKTVTLDGAVTSNSEGEIISVFAKGTLTDTPDPFTDHFLVRHPDSNKVFARDGDSGAMVALNGEFVGILRAVDAEKRVAVVVKLSVLADSVRQLGREFRL